MKKVRTSTLAERKHAGQKIVCITAYDALGAAMAEAAGVDLILVGDSLGNTALGFTTTIPVTLDMMIHHAAAVARGASLPLLVIDLPFMTYKVNSDQALINCGRAIQEGGVEAVKIEGGTEMAPTIARLVEAGIPVMAHIGLLPQSVHAMGGYKVQGRQKEGAERIFEDALAIQEAGAFSVVLEGIPAGLAGRITGELSIPTIGIGAGAQCDGQILVLADMLGLSSGRTPKFVKRFANLYEASVQALQSYADEVRQGDFPGPEQTYGE